jgi:hypothetical protein
VQFSGFPEFKDIIVDDLVQIRKVMKGSQHIFVSTCMPVFSGTKDAEFMDRLPKPHYFS